jgi:hypothetical protein
LAATAWLLGCADQPVPTAPSLAQSGAGKGPTVRETDPSFAPQGTTLEVRVLGTGYDQGSGAVWALQGDTAFATTRVKTNSTTFLSSSELRANITIEGDASLALYDVVVVTKGGKRGIGIEKFEVTLKDAYAATFDGGAAYLLGADGLGSYLHDVSCVYSRGGSAGGGVYQLRTIAPTDPCLSASRTGWRYFRFNLGTPSVDLDQDGVAEAIEDAPGRLLAQDAFATGATGTTLRLLILLVNPDGTTELDTRWTVHYRAGAAVIDAGNGARIIEAVPGGAAADIYAGYVDVGPSTPKRNKPVVTAQLPCRLTLTPMP